MRIIKSNSNNDSNNIESQTATSSSLSQQPQKKKQKQNQHQSLSPTSPVTTPYFSIIVDGLHSHPASVKMAYKLNPNKLILVTDAMSAMGLGSGVHTLGSMKVNINYENDNDNTTSGNGSNGSSGSGRATICGTDVLAGSVISMDSSIRNLKLFTGCTTYDALATATLHPARVLHCEDEIGLVGVGLRADLVLLSKDDLNVRMTWVGGKVAYSSN
jgi:N-acetylglucosamine-6-phosphate deacetylase